MTDWQAISDTENSEYQIVHGGAPNVWATMRSKFAADAIVKLANKYNMSESDVNVFNHITYDEAVACGAKF